ncbi:hypothetical protein [Streptomyces sp. NPDC060002]
MRRPFACLTAAAITCAGFVAAASPAAAADPASGSFSGTCGGDLGAVAAW